jgi:hypothetical protein
MYDQLETRQLENGFKYNENYIHRWITHSTQCGYSLFKFEIC